MKTAVILVAGTFAFLVALGAAASADVADPRAPVQPIASTLIEGTGGTQASQPPPAEAGPPSGETPAEDPAAQPPAAVEGEAPVEQVAPVAPAPDPAPAAEAVVRAVPARDRVETSGWEVIPQPERLRSAARGFVGNATQFLGHLAEACSVGVAKGPGAPVLAFAVLATALLVERRWLLWGSAGSDDDRPSYLSALEVIDPG